MDISDSGLVSANAVLAFGALAIPAAYLAFSRHRGGRRKMFIALVIHLCLLVVIAVYANVVRIHGYRDYQFAWLLLYPLNAVMVIVYLAIIGKTRRLNASER